jgi:hypothetical protein
LKHLDGHIEEVKICLPIILKAFGLAKWNGIESLNLWPTLKQVPYFCLPANDLVDVIAPSCYRYSLYKCLDISPPKTLIGHSPLG